LNDFIPYGRQTIEEEDIQAVVEVLRSDWLTTGPKVEAFEKTFADYVGAKYAVAVSSGTAALHSAMYALDILPGDEIIVPPMTFAATANACIYQQGKPVFSDVQEETLLIEPGLIGEKITPRTKAVVAVDFAGQPCDYDMLREISSRRGLVLAADASHALGAEYKGRKTGSLADLNIFSFHPVKHLTTGEGGMVTTDNPEFAGRMRIFRNHGISTDHRQRAGKGTWFYAMEDLGYNYRITDFQCALGLSQLRRFPGWLERRREIAGCYDKAFSQLAAVEPLLRLDDRSHAYHLYVIRLKLDLLNADRARIFTALRQENLGVNVHYIPVHLHPYYQRKYGTGPGLCPAAEEMYERIISLPLFHGMTAGQVETVISAVSRVINRYSK